MSGGEERESDTEEKEQEKHPVFGIITWKYETKTKIVKKLTVFTSASAFLTEGQK